MFLVSIDDPYKPTMPPAPFIASFFVFVLTSDFVRAIFPEIFEQAVHLMLPLHMILVYNDEIKKLFERLSSFFPCSLSALTYTGKLLTSF